MAKKVIIFILMGVFLLTGCKPKIDKKNYNQKKTKEITRITEGRIKPDSKIAVQFLEKQIKKEDIGKYVDEDVFVFAPKIKGSAYWKDEKTVVFEPTENLNKKIKYGGILNLKKLFGFETNPERVGLTFDSSGNEIVGSFFWFEPENKKNNTDMFQLNGYIEFLQPQSLENVEKSIKLSKSFWKNTKLTVSKKSDKIFTVKSEVIEKKRYGQNFKLKINGKKLFLKDNISQNCRLSPHGVLEIDKIEEAGIGEKPSIKISFFDLMIPEKDYKDFIRIEPNVYFTVKAIDNYLLISGDFKNNMKYKLSLFSGIDSLYASYLPKERVEKVEITIGDVKPKIEFSNDGVFLTSAKDKKISIKTINVERVYVEVKKVLEEDIISFVEENGVAKNESGELSYDSYNFKRVGKIVANTIIPIEKTMNKWVHSELDLSKLITKNGAHGLYIIQIKFHEQDASYFPEEWDEWQKSDYIYSNGQKVKHLIFTDVGITAKKDSGKIHVFLNDIISAKPIKGGIVLSKTKENITIDAGDTDENGMCELKKSGDYIEARYNDQYTILKLNESELSSSVFDTDGINTMMGIKAFIYTDRGVYRPGESINISAIVRNSTGTFPDNHPVKMRVYNPKNNLVTEKTNKISKDGFYGFKIPTQSSDFTGEWKVELNVGGALFTHKVKVEEIVPYTLKVNVTSDKKELSRENKDVKFKVESKYLFGMPSAGLQCNNDIKIEAAEMKFPTFRDYLFSNEAMEFETISGESIGDTLDKNGETEFSYTLPEITKVPSSVNLTVKTKVIEKSGRNVPWQTIIPIKTYKNYVGIEKLKEKEFKSGSKIKFKFVLVDELGKAVPNKELEYRIYRAKNYWWWEFDSEEMFRKNYKSDTSVELIQSGKIISSSVPMNFDYTLADYGEMLFEVEDKESGHVAGIFFGAHWWTDGKGKAGKNADITTIKCNKDKYEPGDTAEIYVKTPPTGKALITVEKSGVIISKEWKDITSTDTKFKLEIKENMVPNVYFSVSVYQPYKELKNDLPIRLYAATPVMVEKKDTKLEFEVKTSDEIKPNSDFTIEIQTKDKKEAQFTVAVVDEGLLGITNFETPDPLKYFFKKERMITQTFDTYSDIIGLTWGNISKSYSIGGDGYNLNKESVSKSKRFDPVVFYEEPFITDKNGNKKLKFKMSNYIGAVRVMVIGVRNGSYGVKDKNITVKAPLMVMPSLPRVLGTEDIIDMPVTIFGMKDGLGNVSVSLSVTGPVQIIESKSQTVYFDKKGESDISFKLKALNQVGVSKIKVSATNGKEYSEKTVEITVRPYNPSIFLTKEIYVAPGTTVNYNVPAEGVKGTGKLKVDLSNRKNINISNRLKWLIQYPYGCIEQTTSGLLPQLYLKNLFSLTDKDKSEIDKNINSGIERLRKFQTISGGFSYWPGEKEENLWGTNYAGHFLLEAKAKGYFVPEDMLEKWVKFQLEKSNKISENYKDMCYRLYVLAIAKKPDISTMNLIKESYLSKLDDTDTYLLAGAYKLAGYDVQAAILFNSAGAAISDYNEFSGNFGSELRDRAVILEITTLFKNYSRGLIFFNNVSEKISSENWYSTQATGYSLMALSKYIESSSGKNINSINATIIAGGTKYGVNSNGKMSSVVINKGFGENMKITNNSKNPIFAVVNWEAIPTQNSIETVSENLNLDVNWLNEDGEKISPKEIRQGETFWGHFKVSKKSNFTIDEVALVQIIPSGWEIENSRISGELAPIWASNFNLGTEQYLDIRDDRIMWFFDMKDDNSYDFLVKINAVTTGEFYLSPTLCEAMYNNSYKATLKGEYVRVIKK